MFDVSKIAQIWATVSALVPVVRELIDDAEKLFPEGGKGSDKLAAVKAGLEAFWAQVSGDAAVLMTAWPTIQAFIGGLVAVRNALGAFRK